MSSETKPAALVWVRDRSPDRRSAPSEQAIVAAAIDIADAEGLDAVSMRRVAAAAGTGTTSMYRYITDRDELIELMVDAVYARRPDPVSTGSWREGIAESARGLRALTLAHPWLAQQSTRRPALGPNVLRFYDHALGVVADAVPDPTRAGMIVGAVNTFVHGAVGAEIADRAAQQASGVSEEQWRQSVGIYVRHLVESGRYPHFAQQVLDADDVDHETRFEFGLGALLAGFAID